MFSIKRTFILGAIYLSAIIGAGFASGREIMTYFGRYGFLGFAGLIFSCMLIGFCGGKALEIIYEREISSPHDFNIQIGGKHIGRFLTILCGLFSYSAYVIMLAGIRQLTGENIVSVILVSICAYGVLYKGFGTLANICGILAPLSALFIMIIALYGRIKYQTYSAEVIMYDKSIAKLIISALLYSGYNLLTSICMLGRCKKIINSKKTAFLGGLTGGLMLLASGGTILFSLIKGKIPPVSYEMPILALFGANNVVLIACVLLAMLVSAITGLTGTCVFFENIIGEKKLGIILAIIAIPLSYISFGNLMDFIYPIFGFAGIFLMIMLALTGNKKV